MSIKHILYAEDNPDDVVIFKIGMKRAKLPHVLHCAEDGAHAIAYLSGDGEYADRKKYPLPDLIILDLKMPRKTGFDVLEWMQNSTQFANIPAFVLSSSDDPQDVQRATTLGATKYFVKSAFCQTLMDHLATLG